VAKDGVVKDGVAKEKMADSFLILDVGSSSLRATVYSAEAKRVAGAGARRAQHWHQDGEGQPVLHPLRLLENVSSAVDEALARFEGRGRIVAVGLTTLVGNLLGVDESGEAVTPIYSYADTRSQAEADELKRRLGEGLEPAMARTGCPFHASYWPAQLLHIAKAQPELFERVARWTDLASYLTWQWFGKEPAMSFSVASWTGLLDRQRLRWDEELLSYLPLDPAKLPELGDADAPASGLAGAWAARWPALKEAGVYGAIGDGAAANLGSAGLESDALVVTIGSTSAARLTLRGCPPRPSGLWAYRVDARYSLLGGALSEGGSSFAWLQARLKLPPLEALEVQLAAQQPAAHGLTVLPFLKGERAPGWQAEATAAVLGLKDATTNVEMVRAWLEAVVYRLALVIEKLPQREAIIASGGALLGSPVWQQILADVAGKPVYLADEPEASSRGVALLLAHYRGTDLPPQPLGTAVHPNPLYRDTYLQARAEHERLYDLLYPQGEGG
jgi:gluconokinase